MQQTIIGDPVPLEAVRKTLAELDTPALDIYKTTGLNPSWQQAFRNGRLRDPGYSKVCTLLAWLRLQHHDALAHNVEQAGRC